MSIRRWEPFNDLMSMRDALDRLFEERFRAPAEWGTMTSPAIDMYQTDKDVVVRASLPGVKPEDIDISVLGDMLTIKGELKSEETVNREDYYYQERRHGAFSRALSLPVPVQPDQAEAKFEHGVLTLTLPKAEQAMAKKIEIKGGGQQKEMGTAGETPPTPQS
jgi:HSP20 family protein